MFVDTVRAFMEQRALKDSGDAHFVLTLSRARLAQQKKNERIEHVDTEEV